MFSGIFEAKKKKRTKTLAFNLVEISKDFLIFIDLKISETSYYYH